MGQLYYWWSDESESISHFPRAGINGQDYFK